MSSHLHPLTTSPRGHTQDILTSSPLTTGRQGHTQNVFISHHLTTGGHGHSQDDLTSPVRVWSQQVMDPKCGSAVPTERLPLELGACCPAGVWAGQLREVAPPTPSQEWVFHVQSGLRVFEGEPEAPAGRDARGARS